MQHKITTINYQYRSADNWKIQGRFSLAGAMTKDQNYRLFNSLDGEMFVPHQVELDNLVLADESYEFNLEYDHGFHELLVSQTLEDSLRQGNVKIVEAMSGEATSLQSVEDFVCRMESQTWNATREFVRMSENSG